MLTEILLKVPLYPFNFEIRETDDFLVRVGEDEGEHYRKKDGHGSFDNEQPPPAIDPVDAFQVKDCDCEEAATGIANLRSGVEDCGP